MKLNRISASLILLLMGSSVLAQEKHFHFKRKILGAASEGWYALPLSVNLFQSIRNDLTDLRVYHIALTDTLEIPYLLNVRNDKITDGIVELPILNKSTKDGKQFLTVELKGGKQVNSLTLDFKETNFNGFVQLDGSQDQKEWFSIDSLQRILSIQKDSINFKSTTLNFPLTNYRFLRIGIRSDKVLTLMNASFKIRTIKTGVYNKPVSSWTSATNKKTRQTVLDVTLNDFQPVSSVAIDAILSPDFYRNLTIEVLRDSSRLPNGNWSYFFDRVYSGYVTSLQENTFSFPYTLARKIRVTIYNADNPALNIKTVAIEGPQIELVSNLSPGENYLFYGNPSLSAPSYDVIHFENKIPDPLPTVSLEQEENLAHPQPKPSALFENKLWLWGVMAVVIGVLGFFTVKMIRGNG